MALLRENAHSTLNWYSVLTKPLQNMAKDATKGMRYVNISDCRLLILRYRTGSAYSPILTRLSLSG
jgi:hypothetical protein